MNASGSKSIIFGSEKHRSKYKYPNRIFINIHTLRDGASFDVHTVFSLSNEEKLERLRVEIEKYKISSGDKINIEFLSPVSRERKLKEIDNDLAEYYHHHRYNSLLDVDKKANFEHQRFASAMGVCNMDIENI